MAPNSKIRGILRLDLRLMGQANKLAYNQTQQSGPRRFRSAMQMSASGRKLTVNQRRINAGFSYKEIMTWFEINGPDLPQAYRAKLAGLAGSFCKS